MTLVKSVDPTSILTTTHQASTSSTCIGLHVAVQPRQAQPLSRFQLATFNQSRWTPLFLFSLDRSSGARLCSQSLLSLCRGSGLMSSVCKSFKTRPGLIASPITHIMDFQDTNNGMTKLLNVARWKVQHSTCRCLFLCRIPGPRVSCTCTPSTTKHLRHILHYQLNNKALLRSIFLGGTSSAPLWLSAAGQGLRHIEYQPWPDSSMELASS